ncbi:unnamed protein product [Rotaria sp. Silwood2]|nr:unnamed protein product [Rotaria sp. Silwood2]CAF2922555.1 unnamed protein product [Rotaria sp. Silwood2]CAF3978283.1 unnamed protein product [Rotaria sp. Silwood2]CAF4217435.1 unnamed protein product [Rotaria sp. Silwood2]CAF4719879.1 unnamed protein product [Rotaria sp. Silwood2]
MHECMDALHNMLDISSTSNIHENIPQLKGNWTDALVPSEPLIYRKTQLIIDAHYLSEHNILQNGVQETEFQAIKLISLDKLFGNKNEIFLGFGLPNVYLTIPIEHSDGYVKFRTFMIWRQCNTITDTKGHVQSGYFIRCRNLPKDALTALRQAILKHSNS